MTVTEKKNNKTEHVSLKIGQNPRIRECLI